jgi:hypothetical protein
MSDFPACYLIEQNGDPIQTDFSGDGSFSTANWIWNGIRLDQYSLTMRGLIELDSGTMPHSLLKGQASMILFNKSARIEGHGGIKAANGGYYRFLNSLGIL